MSMGLTSDEEDEESTPIINDITSPMEEGTPTAPLNISNNASNNMTGTNKRTKNQQSFDGPLILYIMSIFIHLFLSIMHKLGY